MFFDVRTTYMRSKIFSVGVGWPLALAISLLMGSCGSKQGAGSKSGSAADDAGWTVSDIKLDGEAVTVAGVTFRPPSTWKKLGPSGMRQADYQLGPVGKDTDSSTMAVYFFGQKMGGGVKDNIERWIGQMAEPDGGDPHKLAVSKDLSVDSLPVHYVELPGIYSASVGGMMSGQTVAKPGYRMAAVVVEGPGGNLFFKLTGPEATAQEMLKGFRALILGIKRSPKDA
jgi:hypothetical protein